MEIGNGFERDLGVPEVQNSVPIVFQLLQKEVSRLFVVDLCLTRNMSSDRIKTGSTGK